TDPTSNPARPSPPRPSLVTGEEETGLALMPLTEAGAGFAGRLRGGQSAQAGPRACGLARTTEPRRRPMTNPEDSRHLEIRDETDRTVAQAEVTTAQGPEGTVRTSMHSDPYVQRGT